MSLDLLQLISLIDLTSLNETDNLTVITALCKKAILPKTHVAAVCIYPQFILEAKKLLVNTPVKIATVANFPKGCDSKEEVILVIKKAIAEGVDEIDVVFPYPQFLRGEKAEADDFIRACKAACGEAVLLKVILETGALEDLNLIAEISFRAAHAGADFLKTSTGKMATGATDDAVRVMLETIKKIPRKIGCKVSGGVRTVEQAQQYIQLAQNIMGESWVNPQHFRIGASQLLDEMVALL